MLAGIISYDIARVRKMNGLARKLEGCAQAFTWLRVKTGPRNEPTFCEYWVVLFERVSLPGKRLRDRSGVQYAENIPTSQMLFFTSKQEFRAVDTIYTDGARIVSLPSAGTSTNAPSNPSWALVRCFFAIASAKWSCSLCYSTLSCMNSMYRSQYKGSS